MEPLRPTLWRTCRAIASTTRLRLLWKIFKAERLCVDELARAIKTTRPNATIQLRTLNSRGLITATRDGKKIVYIAQANPAVDYADELLAALRRCFVQNVPIREVFRQATALTHSRRIGLLGVADGTFDDLLAASGMSPAVLRRNLSKLMNRGFVKARSNGHYETVCPKNPLGACLFKIVRTDRMVSRAGIRIAKIISGGQTGADRAALDAAIACGVPHGGWCPKGRRSEDGVIPDRYDLWETESNAYSVRTRMNVERADITLIFTHGPLTGGSLLTQEFAAALSRPCAHVDLLKEYDLFQTLEMMKRGCADAGKIMLNVAGSRASNDPRIYDAVYDVMTGFLHRSGSVSAG